MMLRRMIVVKERKQLSVWGVGPVYALISAALTAGGIIARNLGWLDSGAVPAWDVPMTLAGLVLLIAAVGLYLWAHVRMRLFDHVRRNELVTTGPYAWVRNPVYSAILLLCTGLLLMAYNLWLLLLPPVLWALMTAMLIPTEEKWLRALHGQAYADYCERVNRCIPWPPRRR